MKKFKFLILIIYLALMLTGAGYAYWTDSLAVNTTVSTGELSVRFEKNELNGLKFPEIKTSKYVMDSSLKIGNDDSILTDDNVATVNVPNLYPGAWIAYRLKAVNSGTIPVKISDVDFQITCDEANLLNYMAYEAGIGIDADGDKVIDKHVKFKGELKNFKTDLNNNLNSSGMKNIEIKPGGGIYFYIPEGEEAPDLDNDNISDRFMIIRFNEDAPSSTQNKTIKFNYTVNFKQFNAN